MESPQSSNEEVIEDLKFRLELSLQAYACDLEDQDYFSELSEAVLKSQIKVGEVISKLELFRQDNDITSIYELMLNSKIAFDSLAVKYKVSPSPKQRKNKIPQVVASELLNTIFVCKKNCIELKWLKDLLNSGYLLAYVNSFHELPDGMAFPTASSNALDGKSWIHYLVETLEDSLFGKSEKKLKRIDFYKSLEMGKNPYLPD